MDLKIALGGFVVGALIGLTGMGGGSIMTPMMIFIFHMHPAVAVGTDLLYSSITKIVGSIQHIYQKTVDYAAFLYLSCGSVPGALLGAAAVGYLLHHVSQATVNSVVSHLLGAVYILSIGAILWRWRTTRRQPQNMPLPLHPPVVKLMMTGLVCGFIVGMTSVGSGSLFVAVLGALYPIPVAKLVGTDILQGMVVTSVAAIAHLVFGNVNTGMVFNLLVGSIPGILIGSRLTLRVPEYVIRTSLVLMLGWSSWNLFIK